jgi:hypothetical protein
MARGLHRRLRALRTSGGGDRQVPIPRHSKRSRARHVRRCGGCDHHIPVSGPRALPREACTCRGRSDQCPGDRRRHRPLRRGPRRRHPAPAAVRPAEVRGRRAVRPSNVHPIRNARGRAPARSGGRSATEGDRCRGGRKPRAVRRAGARSFKLRRGCHPSQHYLPLVAEGRITVRPWIKSTAPPCPSSTGLQRSSTE